MKKKDLAKKMSSPMINGKSKSSQKGRQSLNPTQKSKDNMVMEGMNEQENA